jgi:hypothetical protein
MVKVHGEKSQQTVHQFVCPFTCLQKYRTTLELLRHCEKEHKENLGVQHLEFGSFTEFKHWKEQEEERTHTTYVRENGAYHPSMGVEGVHVTRYFVCCRNGNYRGHKSCTVPEKRRPHHKISRKMNSTCISRMYVDVHETKCVTYQHTPVTSLVTMR